MFFVELRRTVERSGPPKYVPIESLVDRTGFRSVYAIDSTTRDAVLSAGSVRDLEGLSVYSDTLFIDFDGEGGDEMADALIENNIQFERFDTGRRGCHIHVVIEPMTGPHVPYSQLQWVKEHATGSWDATIYRAHSIIRLEGTFHEKNPGHSKTYLYGNIGKPLNIPMLSPPPPIEIPGQHEGTRNEAEFWKQILVPKREPGRTNRVYMLGALARECGVEYDDGLEAVKQWAETAAQPPLRDERELLRAYRSGYRG